MINKKWLIVSIFIPIWGTVINVIMLFVEYAKHASFKLRKLIGGMFLSAGVFAILALLFGKGLQYALLKLANLQLEPYKIILIVFPIVGIIMNLVFVLYYKKVFSDTETPKNKTE